MKDNSSIPLVSVIMPVYNAASFLEEALNSILNQTFRDFEFIIINDGSIDNSLKILSSYKDPRIVLINQENQGVARSLNNAIKIAKGKYILRHDADDKCLPDKLQIQYDFLEAHPEFVLCATQVAFMTESGKVSWEYRQPNNKYFSDAQYVEVKREHFNPYSPITHATVLIRTSVLKVLGGYRIEFLTSEDVDLWLRLIGQYKAVVLNKCDYFVRLSKSSATQVHGWKNEFFRNKAFEYYEQRASHGVDDLEAGIQIEIPEKVSRNHPQEIFKGKNFRSDLLEYLLPLHINAGDWKEAGKITLVGLRYGWRLNKTWKSIILNLLPGKVVALIIRLKKSLI